MANYSVAEAKDRLPSLLNAVERGEAVTITRRGKPIAHLTAVVPLMTSGRQAGPVERFLAAWDQLPPLGADLQATLRAMRDGKDGW